MVNGVSSYNNYMSYLQTQTEKSRPDRAEMFNKIDTYGSGGISQSELDAFVQDLSISRCDQIVSLRWGRGLGPCIPFSH